MGVRFILGAAGAAVGASSLTIAHDHPAVSFAGRSWVGDLALLAAGWGPVAAGVVVARRQHEHEPQRGRRTKRVGALLAAVGCAWFVAEWDNPGVGSAGVFTVGLVLVAACPPMVTWMVLAYPGGRLSRWDARLVVAASLAAGALLLGLGPALLFDAQAQGCTQCPDNLVLVHNDPALAERLGRAGLGLGVVAALAAVTVIASGVIRSSPARRRVVAPVAAAGTVYLGLIVWTYLVSVEQGFVGTGETERRLWLAQAGALVGLSLAVVAGRVHVRRAQSALAGIVVALGESTRPGGLGDALARTLGDPGLVVAYPVGDGRYVDANGVDVGLSTDPYGDDDGGAGGRKVTPLVRNGRRVAVLVHRRGLFDDAELVDQVAATAWLALDNERLQAELRAQEAALRASRVRIVEASDRERYRLERDLHDGAQQRLVGLLLGLRLARNRIGSEADDVAIAHLDQAAVQLERAVDDLRELARGIHPAMLTDEGLAAALESLAEEAATPVRLTGLPDVRLAPAVESAAYRVAVEFVKTGATRLSAVRRDGTLVVDVDTPAEPDRLVELEDRVGALDGQIFVDKVTSGSVRFRAEIPCG